MTLNQLASAVDRLAVRGARIGNRPTAIDGMALTERLLRLAELERVYGRSDWLADPDAFFAAREILPRAVPVGRQWRADVVDLVWDSGYAPLSEEHGERYLSFAHNGTAHARWFRGARGARRPTIVAIHGYGGGHFTFEAIAFPVRRWLRSGLDVVLFALPFHGNRRAPGDKLRFPSAWPQVTIEGFRQAIQDLRGLIAHLKAQGAPDVAVTGMSLGGYTTGLLATAEPGLAAAIPLIPLASLADYAAHHGRLVGTPAERAAQQSALERVYAIVSPLGRPSRVSRDRLLVIGATGDRITPIAHAERMARHFGAELVRIDGGHLVQLGRRQAWRAIDDRLRRLGFLR